MDTTKREKNITYNGYRFYRDDRSGYYISTQFQPPKLLHRYIWECNYGEIPKGFHIHHKDFNKANNDIFNLECLTCVEHNRIHAAYPTEKMIAYRTDKDHIADFIRKACDWHRSEEGHKWHKEHAVYCKEKGWKRPSCEVECVLCGKKFIGDTKSKFCCKAHKAKWRRVNHMDYETRVCKNCGKEFQVSRFAKTKFCGVKCRGEDWSKRKLADDYNHKAGLFSKKCSICGKEYKSSYPRGKYCPSCRRIHRRKEFRDKKN